MLPVEARTRIQMDTRDSIELEQALPSQAAVDDEGIVRPAGILDLDRIEEIEQACFQGQAAYRRSQLRYLVVRAHGTCLVYSVNGTLAGMVMVLFRRGASVAGIEILDVHPDYQGRAIGARLLAAAEEEVRRRGILRSRLEVASGDARAMRFYLKAGYRIVKILPRYYKNERHGSKDAVRMVKELQGSHPTLITTKQSLYNHPKLD